MLAAHSGKGEFPKIRTFNQAENSTNSVYRDVEAAEKLYDVSGKVDISELTWEQKERVLRYLFAKINGAKSTSKYAPLPGIKNDDQLSITHGDHIGLPPEDDDMTFLTQAKADMLSEFKKFGLMPEPPNQAQVM